MDLLSRAIRIAAAFHHRQTDKNGEPYILHPLRVMLAQVEPTARIVAVLHDVIEDTPLTLDDLRREGFPPRAIRALERLTKQPGVPYLDYIESLKGTTVARAVKIADIRDNLAPERLHRLDAATVARLEKKYTAALQILEVAP